MIQGTEWWSLFQLKNRTDFIEIFLNENVKMTVTNMTLYWRTGQYPLIIHRNIKVINHWFVLLNTYNRSCVLYNTLYKIVYTHLLYSHGNTQNLSPNIKRETGFSDVWLYHNYCQCYMFYKSVLE